jgi:hypothetical protein
MHLYTITRGIKHDVDRLITELQGKYLEFEYEKGKMDALQLSVRPIQLWEICFPEPKLDLMLATLKDKQIARIDEKLKFLLRKMLHAEKIPELKTTLPELPLYKNNIEISLIGIKKDEYKEGIEQI